MRVAVSFLFFVYGVTCRISCKGLNGQNVEWFVANKLPRGVNASNGRSFIYADSTNPDWQMSKKLIDDEKSAIGATVSQIYKHEPSAFYMMYSDDGPLRGSESYRGHSKGVMLFDHSTGLWLSHSVPNYPPITSYGYPASGVKFAQSFMCVTVNSENINAIGEQMRFIQATPYDFLLPPRFASKYPILRTITQKKSLAKSETIFTSVKHMETVGGTHFTSFAKHKKFSKDLWLDLVVPSTKASLGVQSWLNGGADDLKSTCTPQGSVYDITEINLLGTKFSSSKDHSKWAVSDDARVPLVCVGDLNRQDLDQKSLQNNNLEISNSTWWWSNLSGKQVSMANLSLYRCCRSTMFHQRGSAIARQFFDRMIIRYLETQQGKILGCDTGVETVSQWVFHCLILKR